MKVFNDARLTVHDIRLDRDSFVAVDIDKR